ncbi:MAG: glycosyltransferase family 39 protein, partial [Deltaproteobacteria bacterium]|nr:glycosyltransferase family 39 protein [Deltaproteobacteria bacterium]
MRCEINRKNRGILNKSSFHIFVLLILSSAIFFVNIGGWDLWNPDEPRYAQVAKEMMESGNWILPHLNSRVYPDKPPVFFWLIALSSKIKGEVTSFSARFPSALAAVLGVLI